MLLFMSTSTWQNEQSKSPAFKKRHAHPSLLRTLEFDSPPTLFPFSPETHGYISTSNSVMRSPQIGESPSYIDSTHNLRFPRSLLRVQLVPRDGEESNLVTPPMYKPSFHTPPNPPKRKPKWVTSSKAQTSQNAHSSTQGPESPSLFVTPTPQFFSSRPNLSPLVTTFEKLKLTPKATPRKKDSKKKPSEEREGGKSLVSVPSFFENVFS